MKTFDPNTGLVSGFILIVWVGLVVMFVGSLLGGGQ